MRVLHVTCLKNIIPGIYRQLLDEFDASKDIRDKWVTRLYIQDDGCKSSDNICKRIKLNKSSNLMRYIEFKKKLYIEISEQMENYDVLVLRYSFYDFFQYKFLKSFKKPVFLIHHTKEIEELKNMWGITNYVKAIVEAYMGRKSIALSKGIIGVTEEIALYEKARISTEKKLIIMPNGILPEKNVVDAREKDKINVLFVASHFAPWHGLDLLMESLSRNKRADFRLHIAGRVSDEDRNDEDSRIIYYGFLTTEKLKELIAISDVGLSSFALYRQDMEEACTLKVREYLSLGLPVYSGYKDIFPKEFQYYLKGDADINQILDYAQKNKDVSKKEVALESLKYIDKNKIIKDTYNNICELVGKNRTVS